MASLSFAEVVSKAEELVKSELEANDSSHDFFHIDRVRKTALAIAKEEKVQDLVVVELAALLHDLKDWKYSGSELAGVQAAKSFLESVSFPCDLATKVIHVIEHIGFKNELEKSSSFVLTPELAAVQDADRLDAIGAIGIARCFTFGGSRSRPIYDPATPLESEISKEQYMNTKSPSINHFYEKLLKLKNMMKTETGKRFAEQRHKFMEDYLKQFFAEMEGQT